MDVALASGDGDGARALMGRQPPHWLAGRHARLHLMSDRPAEAIEQATSVVWSDSSGHRDRIEMQLIRAVARMRLGQVGEALTDAAGALTAARPHRHLRAFATVPREDLRVLAVGLPSLNPVISLLDERHIAQIYPSRATLTRLTERETQVLEAMTDGDPISAVAANLHVSTNTVKSQLRTAYHKLGATSRTEALSRASAIGLIAPFPNEAQRDDQHHT